MSRLLSSEPRNHILTLLSFLSLQNILVDDQVLIILPQQYVSNPFLLFFFFFWNASVNLHQFLPFSLFYFPCYKSYPNIRSAHVYISAHVYNCLLQQLKYQVQKLILQDSQSVFRDVAVLTGPYRDSQENTSLQNEFKLYHVCILMPSSLIFSLLNSSPSFSLLVSFIYIKLLYSPNIDYTFYLPCLCIFF